jgi:hypothetical protein
MSSNHNQSNFNANKEDELAYSTYGIFKNDNLKRLILLLI